VLVSFLCRHLPSSFRHLPFCTSIVFGTPRISCTITTHAFGCVGSLDLVWDFTLMTAKLRTDTLIEIKMSLGRV
jgi:hypothetical protein